MKKKILKKIDGIILYLFHNSLNAKKTFHELDKIFFKESADFIYKYGSGAVLLENKKDFWKQAVKKSPSEGLMLEFGVFQGDSINFFSQVLTKNNDSRMIYGFDSFEGLSEDWVGTQMLKSTFDQKGKLPKVKKNVELIKGWIDETLPAFLKRHQDKIAFIHLDMDTYTPTKVVLENTVHLLKPGTIIVFDELLGYPGWKNGEYKALEEVISPKWSFKYISFCEPKDKGRYKSKYVRSAIEIIKKD